MRIMVHGGMGVEGCLTVESGTGCLSTRRPGRAAFDRASSLPDVYQSGGGGATFWPAEFKRGSAGGFAPVGGGDAHVPLLLRTTKAATPLSTMVRASLLTVAALVAVLVTAEEGAAQDVKDVSASSTSNFEPRKPAAFPLPCCCCCCSAAASPKCKQQQSRPQAS
jgi:hypothetical protein